MPSPRVRLPSAVPGWDALRQELQVPGDFPPAVLAEAFGDTWTWDRMTTDVFPSLGRLAVGIICSILIGIVGGLLIGSIRWLRALLEPQQQDRGQC